MANLFGNDEHRRARIARVRERYERELRSLDQWNRELSGRELIGFFAGIAWIVSLGFYADSSHPPVWAPKVIVITGVIIAVVFFWTGTLIVLVPVAFLLIIGIVVLAAKVHFVLGIIVGVAEFVALFLASVLASQRHSRARYYRKYGARSLESLDHFEELRQRIVLRKPFGLALRAFFDELPAGTDWDPDTGIATDTRVDTRPQQAIWRMLKGGITYCLLNPSDPVHLTLFPTVLADPENWKEELARLLGVASWIVIYYDYMTDGLIKEIRLLEENLTLGQKCILVLGPWVKEADEGFKVLTSISRWVFRLDFEQSNGDDWPPMVVRIPAEFSAWLAVRQREDGGELNPGVAV